MKEDCLGIASLLRENPLFCDLDEVELSEVARLFRPIDLSPGELLFGQGAEADRAFPVESGEIGITARLPGDEDGG